MMLVAMIVLITAESYVSKNKSSNFFKSTSNNILVGSNPDAIYNAFARELTPSDLSKIKHYSKMYGIDFRIILSIIKQESRFDSSAISARGATGLMQLMPLTHAEISEKLNPDSSEIISDNLQSGIYYFSKLYNLFSTVPQEDRLLFSLAAYNAGPSRIYDAQEIAAYMGENPNKWSVIENVLPLLSKRYYSLHQEIWDEPRPRNGYFGSWRQTIGYVQEVSKSYSELSISNKN